MTKKKRKGRPIVTFVSVCVKMCRKFRVKRKARK